MARELAVEIGRVATRTSNQKNRRAATAFALAIGAVCIHPPGAALAISNPWIGGNGNWSTPGNWQYGVPAGSYSDATIYFNDTSRHVVTYDYTGTPVTLTSFSIDDQTTTGTVTLNQPNFNLSVGGMEVVSLNATYNLSGGNNIITGASSFLSIASNANNAPATFNVSGTGTVTAPAVNVGGGFGSDSGYYGGVLNIEYGGTMTVAGPMLAWNSSGSSVNLTGGTLTTGTLNLEGAPATLNFYSGTLNLTGVGAGTNNFGTQFGFGTGGFSMLNLSGGTLSVSNMEEIGVGGTAVFLQTGGTHTVGGTLVMGGYLGETPNSSVTVNYNLTGSNAILSAGFESIGEAFTTVFNQSSGLNATNGMSLADAFAATYNLTGGNLNDSSGLTIGAAGGVLNVSGGNMTVIGGGVVGGISGSAGGGILNVTSGNATFAGSLSVYNNSNTAVNLRGGTLSVGSLVTSGFPGRFNWTGGTLSITGSAGFNVGSGAPLGPVLSVGAGQNLVVTNTLTNNGTINLSGGAITCGSYAGTAINNWISGTLSVTGSAGFNVPHGSTVNLVSGQTLNVFSNLYNSGTINLNGGSLYYGNETGNPVNWISGTLSEPVIISSYTVGSGQTLGTPGTMITVDPGGSINVSSGGVVSCNLNNAGGTVTTLNFNVPAGGMYTQTGGTTTINGTFSVGPGATTGIASITGGSFYANTGILGSVGGSGTMTVSGSAMVTFGGGLNFNDFIQNGGSTVVLDQNPPVGEDPELNRAMVGGYQHSGAGYLNGGTWTTPYLKLGMTAGTTGTFQQTGGVLNVTYAMGVGYDTLNGGGAGTGIANFFGGTTNTALLYIGSTAGGVGTVNVATGALLNVSSGTYIYNGNVNQTGGTFNTGEVQMNAAGMWQISGGVTNMSADFQTGSNNGSNVSLFIGGTAVLNVSNTEYIGPAFGSLTGACTAIQNGGTNNVSNQMFVGGQTNGAGSYLLTSGNLNVTNGLSVGAAGIFNQTGGAVKLLAGGGAGDLILGGTYILSNGLLQAQAAYLQGNASFVQTGGTCNSSYTQLDGASLWNQSGGNMNTSTTLNIGTNAGDNATYLLGSGAVLTVGGSEYVGNANAFAAGSGTFIQTGGTHTVGGGLLVGGQNQATGSFTLTGGSLNASGYITTGTVGSFNQNGGNISILGSSGNFLYDGGSYLLAAGDLKAAAEYLQGNTTGTPSTFLQTGGTQELGSFISVAPATGNVGVYNITGGSLTVNSITVGASPFTPSTPGGAGTFILGPGGSLGISSNLTNRGTTIFSGNQTWSANATLINFAGTTTFNSDAGANGQNLLVIQFGGSVVFAGTQHIASLDVTPGNIAQVTSPGNGHRSMLYTKALSLAGTLDITNSDLDFQAGGSNAYSTIWSMIRQGYNGGAWNGSGITSSTAANDSTHLTAVGVILNANYTTLDNAPVSISDVLVKYTYYGDTDLSGKVDGSDYSRVDVAFMADQSNPAALTGWINGDFNYDGSVNGSDYTLMDNAFNMQTGVEDAQVATATAQIAGTEAASASVPEPGMLAVLGLGAMGMLGRRRNRVRNIRRTAQAADILCPC